MFSDLECDYINPIDLCNKLNHVRVAASLGVRSAYVRCPVRAAGTHSARLPRDALPAVGAMGGVPAQCAATGVQRQQVRRGPFFLRV